MRTISKRNSRHLCARFNALRLEPLEDRIALSHAPLAYSPESAWIAPFDASGPQEHWQSMGPSPFAGMSSNATYADSMSPGMRPSRDGNSVSDRSLSYSSEIAEGDFHPHGPIASAMTASMTGNDRGPSPTSDISYIGEPIFTIIVIVPASAQQPHATKPPRPNSENVAGPQALALNDLPNDNSAANGNSAANIATRPTAPSPTAARASQGVVEPSFAFSPGSVVVPTPTAGTLLNAPSEPSGVKIPSGAAQPTLAPGTIPHVEGLLPEAEPEAVEASPETSDSLAAENSQAELVASDSDDLPAANSQSSPSGETARPPLLAGLAFNVEALDQALNAVASEIDKLGGEFAVWLEEINLPPWAAAVTAAALLSYGGRQYLKRRARQADELDQSDESSTWLFTQFQTPPLKP